MHFEKGTKQAESRLLYHHMCPQAVQEWGKLAGHPAGGKGTGAHLVCTGVKLRGHFADYRVLRYEERTQGEGTAAIVAQKPS